MILLMCCPEAYPPIFWLSIEADAERREEQPHDGRDIPQRSPNISQMVDFYSQMRSEHIFTISKWASS